MTKPNDLSLFTDFLDSPVNEFFPLEHCEFLEDGEDDPSVESDSDDCGCDHNGRGGRR